MADNDEISRRAHEIWEREGRPDGQSDRHWREAAASLDAREPETVKKAGSKKAEKLDRAKADAKPAKKAEKKKASAAVKSDAKKAEPSKKKGSGKGAKKAG